MPKNKKELEMCKKLAQITPGYVVPTINVDSRSSSSVNDIDDDDNGDDDDTDGDSEKGDDDDGGSDDIGHVRTPPAPAPEKSTKPRTSKNPKTKPSGESCNMASSLRKRKNDSPGTSNVDKDNKRKKGATPPLSKKIMDPSSRGVPNLFAAALDKTTLAVRTLKVNKLKLTKKKRS